MQIKGERVSYITHATAHPILLPLIVFLHSFLLGQYKLHSIVDVYKDSINLQLVSRNASVTENYECQLEEAQGNVLTQCACSETWNKRAFPPSLCIQATE